MLSKLTEVLQKMEVLEKDIKELNERLDSLNWKLLVLLNNRG